LWFDADGTLFDYNRAEGLSLRRSFEALNLSYEDGYLAVYQSINQRLWQALERHEISPDALRIRRFELLLAALDLTGVPETMSSAYTGQLALCTDLVEGAEQVLTDLSRNSRIAIVTNGLSDVQRSRLDRSRIRVFIDELIISEEVGSAKPGSAFFEAAMARTGRPAKQDVLVIGDSLSSDMQGGAGFGLDTCWFNPAELPRPAEPPLTYEIRHLVELLEKIE
jgi:YjjG family noncanonical pyrimidine nucleotidase